MPARLTSTLAAAGIVAAIALWSGASQAAHAPVAVFPAAGTQVASPTTQISFRGATPGALTGIDVRGSASGSHAGTLEPHSDGQGASFVLDQPFRPGEQATVKADVPLIGASNGVVKFTVARPQDVQLPRPGDPGGNPHGAQHFHTRPDLQPPSVIVASRDPRSVGQGDIFVGPKSGPGQDGVLIADGHGRLVWFQQVPKHTSAFDFRVQSYRGRRVLTWWQGQVRSGQGLGVGLIYDNSYRPMATVHAGNGYQADLHEFEISRHDTALLLAYQPVSYGGEIRMDTLVQEVDIPTGLVMFEWHSLGQIPPSESYQKRSKSRPYDVAHVNSIQMEPDGNLLISARHTYAVYELNHQTGKINWRLGGKRSDFKLSKASQFIAQHHARLQPDGSITLFDNGGPPYPGRASRALWLNVHEAKRTVTVRKAYHYPHSLRAFSQGSMQVMPGGDVFVGWGGKEPFFSEYTGGATLIFDAHFSPKGDDSYRAYRLPWSARPAAPPDVAASIAGGNTSVYASWNGATDVAKWEVLAGSTPAVLVPVGTAAKTGFETHLVVNGAQHYVAVRARSSKGQVLGTSNTVHAG